MSLTKQEAMIITAYTGVSMVNFGDFQLWCDDRLGRSTWTHEYGTSEMWEELKANTRDEFLALCAEVAD